MTFLKRDEAMSEVLHLSGASVWTAPETASGPEREPASSINQTFRAEPDPPMDSAPTVSVTEKLAHLHSGATPYLQYLMRLVHRIFLTTDRLGGPIRSVAFSAVDTRHDSSLVPAGAAELLASRVTGRVCLVDADFYSPTLHQCYCVSNDIGFIDAMSGSGPVRSYARRLIQGTESSLWLLPAGSTKKRRELLLSSEETQSRISDLLSAFDYLIIAAPSVTQHPAAAALTSHVDGVVMIAEAHVTRRRAITAL